MHIGIFDNIIYDVYIMLITTRKYTRKYPIKNLQMYKVDKVQIVFKLCQFHGEEISGWHDL